jgi:hypothetical protein
MSPAVDSRPTNGHKPTATRFSVLDGVDQDYRPGRGCCHTPAHDRRGSWLVARQ